MLFISIAIANGNANILLKTIPQLHESLLERSVPEKIVENESEPESKHILESSDHFDMMSNEVKTEESELTQEEEGSLSTGSEGKGRVSKRYLFYENSFVLQEESSVRENLRKIYIDYCHKADVQYMSPIRYSSIYRCCSEESGDLYSEMKMYKM